DAVLLSPAYLHLRLAIAGARAWLDPADRDVCGDLGVVYSNAVLVDQPQRTRLTRREPRAHKKLSDRGARHEIGQMLGLDRIGSLAILVDAIEFALRLLRRGDRVELRGDRARELALRLTGVQLLPCERLDRRAHLAHRELGRPFVVVRHQRVVDRHDLAVDLARRVGEPDRGRWLRLMHLVAVEAFEELDDEDRLRWLADHLLQLAAPRML